MDITSSIAQRLKLFSVMTQTNSIILDASYIDDSSLPEYCSMCPKANECKPKEFHKQAAATAFAKNEPTDYRCQENRIFFASPISQIPLAISEQRGNTRYYSILSYAQAQQPKSDQRRAIRAMLADMVKASFVDATHSKTIVTESNTDTVHPGFAYLIKQEEKILSLISSHDTDEAKKFLDSYIGYIMTVYNQDPAMVRTRISELIVLAGRACINAGADAGKILELTYAYLNNIAILADIQAIRRLMVRTIDNFETCFEESKDTYHVQTIQRIKEYINENYYKKITLEDIADLVHLSKSHLSRVINNSLGCRLCTYVNSVRVEKSFGFLMDPWLNLSDVAKLCGFDGQSYFTKVFKLHTGVSPGRYREMNMRNNK